jgi:hypothetical protein
MIRQWLVTDAYGRDHDRAVIKIRIIDDAYGKGP